MLSNRLYKTSLLATLFIFAFSTFTPALTYAAPLSVSEKNWERVNGNSWAQNNSPQTQINRDNVDALEVKWMYPISASNVAPDFMQGLNAAEGSPVPPIVANGMVYMTTLSLMTFAVDAETGKEVWRHSYEIDIDEAQERLPINPSAPHIHGIRYWGTEDALLVTGIACDYEVIDAKTGEVKYTIGPHCQNVPGSLYTASGFAITNSVADLGTYEKGRLFIGGMSGNTGGTVQVSRSYTWAIDMDNPDQVVWRFFWQPPQDRPDDEWALHYCDVGWFYTIPCSQVEEQAPQNLLNDWQMVRGETPHWIVGTASAWGEVVVDEDTGIVYMATGNSSPYPSIGYRPGPNLYAETLLALDLNTGTPVWWVNDAPRDPWDYDCNWNGILADVPALGKVYIKGCKLGYLHVRDALTGEPIHWIDTRAPGQYDPRMGEVKGKLLGTKSPLNPLNEWEMREFIERDEYPDTPYIVNPTWFHGSFGSDISYHDGTVFHYVMAGAMTIVEYLLPENLMDIEVGGGRWRTAGPASANATLVARDVVTGDVKWMYFYPWTGVRGYPTITGNMVIMPHPDGYLRFLDEDTGVLLREMNLGGPLIVGTTVGQDNNGDSKIFVPIGNMAFGCVGCEVGAGVPGTLVAIGLSERAAAEVKTTTVTTTTTTTATTTTTTTTRITTTTTTTSTTTTATTTTVTTATTRTVTTTSATTVTTTLAPQTITTTTTAPAQTVTTTQEVTETVGLPATVTYAAVAIAVIAIIAAAVLATRRR